MGHVQVPQDVMTKQWSREEVEAIGTLRVIRGTVPKSGWRKSAYTKENAAKMDNEDEAVFLSLPSTDKSPCYLDCENNVYTREGALLKDVTVESLKEHITEELLPLRCPHPPSACAIATLIRIVKNEQDSIGGTVCCAAYNVPIGLGEVSELGRNVFPKSTKAVCLFFLFGFSLVSISSKQCWRTR